MNDQAEQDDYWTSDMPQVAFLHARGFPIKKVTSMTDANGRKKRVFWFSERNLIRRAVLEYHNNQDPRKYNINARALINSLDDCRSLAKSF